MFGACIGVRKGCFNTSNPATSRKEQIARLSRKQESAAYMAAQTKLFNFFLCPWLADKGQTLKV